LPYRARTEKTASIRAASISSGQPPANQFLADRLENMGVQYVDGGGLNSDRW